MFISWREYKGKKGISHRMALCYSFATFTPNRQDDTPPTQLIATE
jgi:hypothetical protein